MKNKDWIKKQLEFAEWIMLIKDLKINMNKNNKTTSKWITKNGIQKTPYGTYRVRKTRNGVTILDKCYKTMKAAKTVLSMFK